MAPSRMPFSGGFATGPCSTDPSVDPAGGCPPTPYSALLFL